MSIANVASGQGDQTTWEKIGPKCSPTHFCKINKKLINNFYRRKELRNLTGVLKYIFV
jgi:hypothetical protein